HENTREIVTHGRRRKPRSQLYAYYKSNAMRRIRWLLPLAILAILGWVMVTYVKRKATLASEAPVAPRPLEQGLQGRANDWEYTQHSGDLPRVRVRAKSFKQIKE